LLDTVSFPIINLGLHDWSMDAFAQGWATMEAISVCAINRVIGCMRQLFDATDAERKSADDVGGHVAKVSIDAIVSFPCQFRRLNLDV
jgi:hypothetical protein